MNHIYIHTHTYTLAHIDMQLNHIAHKTVVQHLDYGVATIGGLLQIKGLFCGRAL